MSKVRSFLVGSHFVPPAKAVIAGLPGAVRLRLVPCDGERAEVNPYDENAIQVHVYPSEVIWGAVDEAAVVAMGSSFEELKAADSIMLGHLAASGGKPLSKAQAFDPSLRGNVEVRETVGGGWDVASVRGLFEGELLVIEVEGEGQ